jgi:hypothetical protein
LQPEFVPNVQNENRSNDGYNYSSEMKFATCAWRIKQVGYGAANDRADNSKHDCPRDRKMRMHERLGDTTHKKANNNVPNEMKHIFLLIFAIWKSTQQ